MADKQVKRHREAPLSCFMLTNQLDPKDWQPIYDEIAANMTWIDTEKQQAVQQMDTMLAEARNGNIVPLVSWLKVRLNGFGLPFVAMYAILHDKDSRKVWSEAQQANVIDLKSKHIHVVVKLQTFNAKPNPKAFLAYIANACGVLGDAIEKPKSGRYAYDNMIAYLVHAKDKDKYQYDPKEVISIDNSETVGTKTRNYSDIFNECRDTWERGAATKKKQAATLNVDWLIEMILTGQVTRSQVNLTDELFEIYARNAGKCDEAFRIYGERRAYKTMQALQNGEFKLTVFFITGRSGTGKSRFAKLFIQSLIDKSKDLYGEPWRCCEAASSNPVDDYQGEEIMRMDDLRGNAMSASDWLKLLDPYNITPSSARYRNKTVAARVIVITSEKDPIEYFYYARTGGGDRSEALDQFIRRIQALVQVVPYGDEFENAQYRISTTAKVGQHLVQIPNSANRQTGKPEQVAMTYTFDNTQEMPLDDAVQALVSEVMKNNKTVEDMAEEAEQEHIEALLAEQAQAEQDYIEEQLRLAGIE